MIKGKFTSKKYLEALQKLADAGISLVVDDNGHDSHKAETVSADGTVTTVKIQSLVAVGKEAMLSDVVGQAVSGYEIDGQLYTCNETLGRTNQSLLESYQYSNETLALFSNCVERLNVWDRKLIVATTLPVKRLDVDDNVEKVKAQFKKLVVRPSKGDNLNVLFQFVFAEGHAAFYDWVIDYKGNVNPEVNNLKTVLIVDIGGGTTDLVTLTSAGELDVSVDKSRSFTLEEFGLVALKDEVAKLIKTALQKELPEHYKEAAQEISHNTIDSTFETGFVNFMMLQKPIDLTKEIETLKKDWVKRLIRKIVTTVKRLDSYNKILIAGGGGVALEAQLQQEIPGCSFLDEYANANGLMKLLVCIFATRLADKYATVVEEA